MKKPVEKVMVEGFDYSKCAEYIASKLGVKDLRDFAGKYTENKKDAPYLDFWHCAEEFGEEQRYWVWW